MTLEQKIAQDLKTAMKAKDDAAKRGIRAIKAAVLLAKTDGSGAEIDGGVEIKILQKLVKQRQESLDIYTKQGREDLAKKEREEIDVIKRYLPEPLSPAELEAQLKEIIAEVGAESMRDMGKVMGAANQRFAGRADGRTISTKVKELLS